MTGPTHIIIHHAAVFKVDNKTVKENPIPHGGFYISLQVVGGKMTEAGRLGAFITKVKKGSLADVVGHLRAGTHPLNISFLQKDQQSLYSSYN